MYTTINRDPFGRTELVRELVPAHQRLSCGWCGSRQGRFRYGTEPDDRPGRTTQFAKGTFCSVGCFRSYHS